MISVIIWKLFTLCASQILYSKWGCVSNQRAVSWGDLPSSTTSLVILSWCWGGILLMLWEFWTKTAKGALSCCWFIVVVLHYLCNLLSKLQFSEGSDIWLLLLCINEKNEWAISTIWRPELAYKLQHCVLRSIFVLPYLFCWHWGFWSSICTKSISL